jgi:predicted short-subunit dehydrogenase-like oxidoreductase (DUF2520 family)
VDVSVVGAGTLGTAIAVLLDRAGYTVAAVAGREHTGERVGRYLSGVRVVSPTAAAGAGEVVFVTTPDDAIEPVCRRIADGNGFRSGQTVVHCSGALGLDVLEPARAAGASRLCLHPLQTFPDADAALRSLPGASIAITADDEESAACGERLARDVGGRPGRLAESAKPLYHAAAVFASNYLVAIEAVARDLFAAAGLDDPLDRLLPLARSSTENVAATGPERALTGPAVRGDAGTIERNLRALKEAAPGAIPTYVALARHAVGLGSSSGRLPDDARARVEEVLNRWT